MATILDMSGRKWAFGVGRGLGAAAGLFFLGYGNGLGEVVSLEKGIVGNLLAFLVVVCAWRVGANVTIALGHVGSRVGACLDARALG